MTPHTTSAVELDHAEEQMRAELRRFGMKWTRERSVVLRTFLQTAVSVPLPSYTSVYRTLKKIAACGLAKECGAMVER
jgi:Fe2+ or Zn2+ uptake regulation protein